MIDVNKITLIVEENEGYEWLYVNENQIATGEPIESHIWLDVMKKFQPFLSTKRLVLTETFINRVDGNLLLVPKHLNDFQEDDLI